MIIPPYPFTLENPAEGLLTSWYARPQLYFSCLFRPVDGRPPCQGDYTRGPDDFEMQQPLQLVVFSTFKVLKLLLARSPMDDATTKLYEPSPTPILFVAPFDNVLGRMPLFPLFLDGNATPIIPTHLYHLKATYHIICATSKPALSSMGPPMPPDL